MSAAAYARVVFFASLGAAVVRISGGLHRAILIATGEDSRFSLKVMNARMASAIAIAALVAACGAPTTPSVPPSALTIVPPNDLIVTQESITYSVIGTFPDGSSRGVAAKWLVDNPAVARVNAAGIVIGIAPGSTTLIATTGGQTTSRVLRVVPDVNGNWAGQAKVTGCGAGDFRTCGRCCPNGQLHSIALTLTQARDRASGTLQIDAPTTGSTPTYTGAVAGPIQLDGSLVLQGTLTGRFLLNGQPQTIEGPTLFDWSTTVESPGAMNGHFTSVTSAGFFFPTRVSYDVALTRAGR